LKSVSDPCQFAIEHRDHRVGAGGELVVGVGDRGSVRFGACENVLLGTRARRFLHAPRAEPPARNPAGLLASRLGGGWDGVVPAREGACWQESGTPG